MNPFRVVAPRGVLPVLLCTFLLAAPPRAAAQDAGDAVLQRIQDAFAEGNARVLLAPAAERVEISMFGVNTLYSRAQALYVMQDFFREYVPRRFQFREPSKADGSWFAAGSYWYGAGGGPLQVYVRLRQKEHQWELREIRIEQRLRE